MSDFIFLNKNRCKTPSPTVPAFYCSRDEDGFNGMFRFYLNNLPIRVLASDGEGWQHVSVSIERSDKCPTWEIMCKIKQLFWEDEDVVVQYHPKKSEYVNNHPNCLHLWRCLTAKFPTPPTILVGLK